MKNKKLILFCILFGVLFYGVLLFGFDSKLEASKPFKIITDYINNDEFILKEVGNNVDVKARGNQVIDSESDYPYAVLNVILSGDEGILKAEFYLLLDDNSNWYIEDIEFK